MAGVLASLREAAAAAVAGPGPVLLIVPASVAARDDLLGPLAQASSFFVVF